MKRSVTRLIYIKILVFSISCVLASILFVHINLLFENRVYLLQYKDNNMHNSWNSSIFTKGKNKLTHMLNQINPICENRDTVHLKLIKKTTQDIQWVPQIPFIEGLKNPCFCVSLHNNITSLRCLPYMFLAGFPKCGTTDLFSRLLHHPHMKVLESFKELHFWDNVINIPNFSLSMYSIYFKNLTKTVLEECNGDRFGDCPFISGDFTPRTAYHADNWDKESWNLGSTEPTYLTPHKIHRILPNAKLIFMLRDPTERLFSDYRYSSTKNRSSQGFHLKVLDAVDWWMNCTASLSERACAYGLHYPPNVTPLGRKACSPQKACHPKVFNWQGTSGDRLRISLYVLYIQDWLKVFNKEAILLIKFEEYVQNPWKTITDKVLPFLNLTFIQYRTESAERLLENSIKNKNHIEFKMEPETRKLLQQFFKPYNQRLQDLLAKHKFDVNLTSYYL